MRKKSSKTITIHLADEFQITGLSGEREPYLTFRNSSEIRMDTLNNKEGVHLWIINSFLNPNFNPKKKEGKENKKFFATHNSVHLNRNEAFALIQEIRDRLFD